MAIVQSAMGVNLFVYIQNLHQKRIILPVDQKKNLAHSGGRMRKFLRSMVHNFFLFKQLKSEFLIIIIDIECESRFDH